jgi:hypothetical protein
VYFLWTLPTVWINIRRFYSPSAGGKLFADLCRKRKTLAKRGVNSGEVLFTETGIATGWHSGNAPAGKGVKRFVVKFRWQIARICHVALFL